MARERNPFPERIVRDPDVMVGKPVIKGTRIPVKLVLQHLAENPDLDDLFTALPRLTREDVQACLAHARSLLAGEERRKAVRHRSA